MHLLQSVQVLPDPIAEFRQVGKRFGDVVAAQGLNLSIQQGEFLSFLGPSSSWLGAKKH